MVRESEKLVEEGEAVVNKNRVVVINCRHVWKEVSNYVDGLLATLSCTHVWKRTLKIANTAAQSWTARAT